MKKRQMIAVFSKDDILNVDHIRNLGVACGEMTSVGETPYFFSGVDYYNEIAVVTTDMSAYNMDELIRACNNAKKIIEIEELYVDTCAMYEIHNANGLLTSKHEGKLENLDELHTVTYVLGDTFFRLTSLPEVVWKVID